MPPRSIHYLILFLAGCGAGPSAVATAPSPIAETCVTAPSGAWTAPHANFEWADGTLYSRNSAGLWRMTDGAPEQLVAASVLSPAGAWRPMYVAWAEGWWAVLDEEGHLVRGPLDPSVAVGELTLPACVWVRSDTHRRGSLALLPNGDWLLGCDAEIVIADAAGRELSRFSRGRFTAGEIALDVEGRRLIVTWHVHHGVAAFDAATGRRVWRSELRRTIITVAVSPSAPFVLVTHFANEDGSRVEGGRSGLFGLDPRTGGVVWELRYPGPWPREGIVDPRSASQLVPRWIDTSHLSLEATRLLDWEPVGGREIQRLVLGEGAEPPTAEGPILALDDEFGSAIVLPDGTSFGLFEGRYVERDASGEMQSEFAISLAGGARRWADGRIVCPDNACPWARPCDEALSPEVP